MQNFRLFLENEQTLKGLLAHLVTFRRNERSILPILADYYEEQGNQELSTFFRVADRYYNQETGDHDLISNEFRNISRIVTGRNYDGYEVDACYNSGVKVNVMTTERKLQKYYLLIIPSLRNDTSAYAISESDYKWFIIDHNFTSVWKEVPVNEVPPSVLLIYGLRKIRH